jgi:anaerobic magnesium-protoporphyrin IX monomethyl ester cyclase
VKILFMNPQQEMGGMQCLSAFLKRAGHEVFLVNDPNLFDNPWIQYPAVSAVFEDTEHILGRILSCKPDLIGMPVVTDDFQWALKWARRIKQIMDVPIVFGNAHATFHSEDVLKQNCVDFVVRGEGELTLLELVETLQSGGDLKNVLGIGFKRNGQVIVNPVRPLIEDLDILPFPDKDLYYQEMPYLNHGYTTMTGRGCPYRCTFCDNNTSAKLYRKESSKVQRWTRRHSPAYMVKEILWAKEKYNIKHVRFNDEDFSYDKQWIREFAPLYKKEVGIPYFAWVYPNTVDEEIAQLLADSGCDAVEMGIQSGSERIRKDILHRRTSDAQILSSLGALRKAGIRATVDVIIGLPTETKEDLDETIRLLAHGNPWHIYVFWLRYYPATEILNIVKEKGLLSDAQLKYLEEGQHTRGHIAGGTELEQSPMFRRYHAFIVLLPLMPKWLILTFLKFDLVRFFPSFLNPFVLVNVTKMIKRDPYNEFRVRGWKMIRIEGFKLFARSLKRLLKIVGNRPPPPDNKSKIKTSNIV